MLTEDRRKQLDGIVMQMVNNGEPSQNIDLLVSDFKNKYDQQLQSPQQSTETKQPGFFQRLWQDFTGRGQAISEAVQKPAQQIGYGASPLKVAQSFGEAGLRTAGNVAGGALDIVKETAESVTPQFAKEAVGKVIERSRIPQIVQKLSEFEQKHPEAAKDINAIVDIAGLLGLKQIPGAEMPVSEAVSSIKQKGLTFIERLAQRSAQKGIETSIEAVSPELTGKKLVQAYKKQAISGQPIKGAGAFGTQEIAESEQTIKLGKDLSDVLKSSNPTKNLNSLGEEFQKIATNLDRLLVADKTPVIKQAISDTLDSLSNSMPREFRGIRDSERAFKDVIEFAKQKIGETEPNINGLRKARIAFDKQAKIEYPNAFKDGYIDLKTPSGRAIKATRDSLNDYLYNTAEKGSELQKLIKREADIYKALDNIAPKSAKFEGKGWLEKIKTKYPNAYNLVKYGVFVLGAEKAAKELGAPLP